MRDIDPRSLVFVGAGTANEANELITALSSPHRFIVDPAYILYRAFGLVEGRGAQLMGPAVLLGGLRATLKGHLPQAPPTNPRQLGGSLVIDATAAVVWEHRARHAADNASADRILSELRRA